MSDTPSSKADAGPEPEPIDVEFEPADDVGAASQPAPADKGIGMPSVIVASVAAALAGGAIGVVASGNSGLDTAKFAPAEVKDEIARLTDIQRDLNERLQTVRGDLSELTARSLGESERVGAALDARSEGEEVLRSELEGLTAQLAAIIGDGSGAPTPQTSSDGSTLETGSQNPLTGLMTRIETLEARLAAEADAPDTPQKLQRALRDLETRVDAVETADTQLDIALTNRAEALAALQTGLFSANETISEIRQRVDTLETAPVAATADTAALDEELARLAAEIEALKSTPAPEATAPSAAAEPTSAEPRGTDTAAQAALALSAVEAAARRGKPFASAFDRLEGALPRDEDVVAIKPISKRGAPTHAQLQESFEELESGLQRTLAQSAEDDGWQWLRNAVSGVVTVRNTESSESGPAAQLAAISDALEADDIDGAIAAAKEVDDAVAADLKDWLAAAERRADLDMRLDRLRRKLLDAPALDEG